jgi:hypothetical protein
MFNLHVLHASLLQTPQVSFFSGRIHPFSYKYLLRNNGRMSWINSGSYHILP